MSTNISTAPCRPKQNSHWDFPGFWRSHNRFKFEGSDLETWKGHWESNGKCLASLPCTQRPVTVWLGKIRVTCSHWWTHQLLKWMGLRQRSLEMIRVETGVGTPWLRPWIRSHGDHGHIHSLPTANRYSMQHCILSLLSCSEVAIPWTPGGRTTIQVTIGQLISRESAVLYCSTLRSESCCSSMLAARRGRKGPPYCLPQAVQVQIIALGSGLLG